MIFLLEGLEHLYIVSYDFILSKGFGHIGSGDVDGVSLGIHDGQVAVLEVSDVLRAIDVVVDHGERVCGLCVSHETLR